MLALSPFALRLVSPASRPRGRYAGIQQLAHDANLLFTAARRRRRGARPI